MDYTKIKETTYNSLPHTPQIGLILLLFVVYLADPLVKMAPNKGTTESLWTMTVYRWPIDIVFCFLLTVNPGLGLVRCE